MFVYKIEKGSIPSEDIVRNHDYYIIDSDTLERIAYIIEAQDLDATIRLCDNFVQSVMECLYECE